MDKQKNENQIWFLAGIATTLAVLAVILIIAYLNGWNWVKVVEVTIYPEGA